MRIVRINHRTRGFTLTDLCVVLAAMLLLVAALPALMRNTWEQDNRIACLKNLRAIGQGLQMYANQERNNGFPRTYYNYTNPTPTEYSGANAPNPFSPGAVRDNDVTASIFLLMRVMQLDPKVFVCPSSDAIPFDDAARKNTPARFLSNFPSRQYLSYSMNNPFPSKGALATRWTWDAAGANTDYAIVSDMNSGDPSLTTLTPNSGAIAERAANSRNHDGNGQNVLYGDGHVVWSVTPFCGAPRPINTVSSFNDNIFTANTTPPTIGGTPTDNLDSIMLPVATAGFQPPARSKVSIELILVVVGVLVVIAFIVLMVVIMTRRSRVPIAAVAPPGSAPPPFPPHAGE